MSVNICFLYDTYFGRHLLRSILSNHPVSLNSTTMATSTVIICKSCQQPTNNSEPLKCNGICSGFFQHATVRCSGVKHEVSKLFKNGQYPNIKYVCTECNSIKLIHLLKAIEICNDNVKQLDIKVDNIKGVCDQNSRRVNIRDRFR